MPCWKQSPPTEAGIYLRSNPPISFIVRQDVFLGLGDILKVSNPDPRSAANARPVSELPDRFWWYGPIPQPAWKG